MFERATEILKEKGITQGFEIQFVVYRDYDCKDDLLQVSSWESRPELLRKFMAKMTAKGGGDYEEAIEVGLWHCNQEAEAEGISQVILIGDAPAKQKKAIAGDRNTYGGSSYWNKTKYAKETYYVDEMEKLAAKRIPVHAFYVNSGPKENFTEIATKTGGRCFGVGCQFIQRKSVAN